MSKTIEVPEYLVRHAVKALRDCAHNEAGMSQAPDLVVYDEVSEWKYADKLEALLTKEKKSCT